MSKRPLPNTSTGEPYRKRSSFRFARDPSEVVVNSTKVGQRTSGRLKQSKQNTSSLSSSTIAAQPESLLQDQPLQLDDLDAIQVDITPEILSEKSKRKKRTNTTSVSICAHR